MEPDYKIICYDYPPEFILDKSVAKEYFKRFGKLKRITFKIKLRTCIVEYANKEGYISALKDAGEYNGTTFNVSSASPNTPQKPKKKEVKKKEPIWIDKDEIEAELAAMSGAPTPLKKTAGDSQVKENLKTNQVKLKRSSWNTLKTYTKSKKTATTPKKNIKSDDLIYKPVSGEEVELVNLILVQGSSVEQKYRILDARDKLIKFKLKRTPQVKSSATIGTCPDMCPEKERLFREIKHQVAWYEQDDNEKYMNPDKAVKQYSRSSADQEAPLANELRPVPVLQMTMEYLLHSIIDLCDTDEVHLGEWYHFLWDRTRSIRKDITQQELCCQGAVELVEQCARFHIHCSARLVAEDPSVFDHKINTENLTKCLQTLKYMYHDLSLKGEKCQNEAEFRAYIILLNLNDGNFMWELQQLRREIQRSEEVRFALKVYSALDKNNYVTFFKLVNSTTYLNGCILMRYFNQVRISAIKTLLKCCVPRAAKVLFALSELHAALAFDDINATIDFLKYFGLSINDEKTSVILYKHAFIIPEFPYILDRSTVIEDKRKDSVSRIICGKDLPPKAYETHKIQNSFDEDGYLINKDILDDVDLEKVKLRLLEELKKSEMEVKEESKKSTPESKKSDLFSFTEKLDSPFTFITKETSTNKSPFTWVNKDNITDNPFLNKKENVDDLFGVVKKEEKVEHPFKFVKKYEKTDSPFKFVKNEDSDNQFKFVKKEEKLSNPFALTQGESSKSGSIFDTTPPTPKNIFASPFVFQLPFASKDQPISSKDQSDFSFIKENVSFAPPEGKSVHLPEPQPVPIPEHKPVDIPERKPVHTDTKMGGFKFDLVVPPPKHIAVHPSEVPQIENHKQIENVKTEEEKLNESKKLEEALQMKIELKKKAEEQLRIIEERKKLELKREQERRIQLQKEEQRKLEEKRLKELKKKMQEEELKRRLDELKREKEKLKELETKLVVNKLITSLIDEVDNRIRNEKLLTIKDNMKRRLLMKVFQEWKSCVTNNQRKRKAVDCSPLWINSKTLQQSAEELHTSSQELTLALMKRYKYGKPLDIGHCLDEDIKNVNLFELTYSILKNKIYKLAVNKPKNIFWKVIVSLPDSNELTVGLHRMEETMESAFPWTESNNRQFHLEHVKANSLESVTYCIERQQGYKVNEYDSNGIIFLAKDFNSNLQRRIFENLRGFGVYTKVPIVIILQEYNASECKLETLIKENIVSDYVVLVENPSACKLVNVVEEGLVFLAKQVESSPPLELDILKSFIKKYLCSEIWKRANSFAKWNSSYKKCLQNPNIVLSLYNEGVNKLRSIVINDYNKEYAVFPEEFKKYLNSEYPDYYPCSFRYFPKFWKTSSYFKKLENIFTGLILPEWSDVWPPPNEYKLELSVAKYSSKITEQSEKLFYKLLSVFLQKVDPNVNFENIKNFLWTDVIGLIGLEKLDSIYTSIGKEFTDSIFKEYIVVYNKHVLNEYSFCDWFYISNPNVKQFVDDDMEKESIKKVPRLVDIDEHLKMSEEIVNSLWNSCLLKKPDKSEMIKELNELKQSLNGLADTMAVQKRISLKLEESLSIAISEK